MFIVKSSPISICVAAAAYLDEQYSGNHVLDWTAAAV